MFSGSNRIFRTEIKLNESKGGGLQPPLVLSDNEEKGEQKEMSTEKAEITAQTLEKMTVKDLREMAKEMPDISGVHGMKKDELILAIKKVKGIEDAPVKKSDASIGEIKNKIREYKAQRQAAIEAKDKKMATIFKRRISRLKKKTRRAAV
jgi:hypothetical protein